MNVDLVQNNPSWVYYIYISIPMFLLLLLSVWILKQLKGFTRAGSGWVVGARNRYKLVLGQRIGNDEETRSESNRENESSFNCAAACGDAATVLRMIGERGDTKRFFMDTMRLAAASGHQEVVEILLSHGADINIRAGTAAQTPLQAASAGGHLALVKYLLTAGADFNTPPSMNGGRTALQSAAEFGSETIVEVLIAEGANVNEPAAEDYGRWTPCAG